MNVHYINPLPRPPKKLSTFIALYASCKLFVSTTLSFHIVSKNCLETELEALNDKQFFPFSLCISLATITGSNYTPSAWDTTGTQLLQLKTEGGTQQYSKPRELDTQLL